MIGCCGGMMWLMVLGAILVTGLIGAGMLALIWAIRRSQGSNSKSEAPLEILRRRLARGELTPEEFEAMKRQLEQG